MASSVVRLATVAHVTTIARRWICARAPRRGARRYGARHVATVASRWTAGLAISPRHHGFSLVELMIVLAILVTLAAIAVPNLQRSFQRNEIREAGRLLQETLGELRHEALQSGRPVYVQLGWGSNSIKVFRDSGWRQSLSAVAFATTDGNADGRTSNIASNSNRQTTSSASQNIAAMVGDLESRAEAGVAWESQEIQLITDVRFQPRMVERTAGTDAKVAPSVGSATTDGFSPATANRNNAMDSAALDRAAGTVDSTTDRVMAWSKPLAILPDGSVEEIQFWLELDRRWQCPVLFRGSTGQLEIGSVQTVKDSTEQPQSRESL